MLGKWFHRENRTEVRIDDRCVIRPGDLILVVANGADPVEVREALEPRLPASANLIVLGGHPPEFVNLSWLAEQVLGNRAGHGSRNGHPQPAERADQAPDRQDDSSQQRVGQVRPVAERVNDGASVPEAPQKPFTETSHGPLPSPEGPSVAAL